MKHQKRLWQVCAAVFLLLAIAFGAAFVYARSRVEEDPDIYSRLTSSQPEEAASSALPVEIPVDFAYWQQINPDVYAWIRIEDTQVDYPVLQSAEDNT